MDSIELTSGKVSLVDDEDFARFGSFNWRVRYQRRQWYAIRWAEGKTRLLFLHREILGAKPGQLIDHKNGNGLDNRRANLRFCDRRGNMQNSVSHVGNGIKGVRLIPSGRYQARIIVNGCYLNLGTFDAEMDAAAAYDVAALKHFGEFARPNFAGIA